MTARRVRIDAELPDPDALEEAAEVIRKGGIVGLPTETYYALAANGLQTPSVSRVLAAKGRSESKTTGLLVADIPMVETLVTNIPKAALKLMERFWPGPLSLILSGVRSLPPGILGDGDGVSLRIPDLQAAIELIWCVDCPLTATSANPTGKSPPRTAKEVMATLGERIDLVLDAGETPGGMPSTIVDFRGQNPVLIRGGAIPWEEVVSCLR